MFNHKHYVAVLRWRKGELAALQKLYDRDRKIITPLIELLPGKGGGFSKIIKDIGQNWGFAPFFLDLQRISATLRLAVLLTLLYLLTIHHLPFTNRLRALVTQTVSLRP